MSMDETALDRWGVSIAIAECELTDVEGDLHWCCQLVK